MGEPSPRRFDRLFYTAYDPVRLAVFRVVTGLVIFYAAVTPNLLQEVPRRLAEFPHELFRPLLASRVLFVGGPPSDTLLAALRVVVAVLAVLVVLGVFTRVASALLALTALPYFGVTYSLGDEIRTLNCALFLAVLLGAFADWGAALSFDARHRGVPRPPPSPRYGVIVRLGTLLVSMLFFVSVAWKLARQGPGWLGGDHLWKCIVEIDIIRSMPPDVGAQPAHMAPLAPLLIAHPWLCQLLEIATLIFESTFILTFFFPRLGPLYVLGAASFHLGIYHTLTPVSGITYAPFYALLIPWERWLSKPMAPVDEPPAARRRAQLLVGAFVGLELVAAVSGPRQELAWQRALWPFTEMRMFTWTPLGNVYQLVLEGGSQPARKVEIGELVPPIGEFKRAMNNTLPAHRWSPDAATAWRALAQRWRCAHGSDARRLAIYRYHYDIAARAAGTVPTPAPELAYSIELPATCDAAK